MLKKLTIGLLSLTIALPVFAAEMDRPHAEEGAEMWEQRDRPDRELGLDTEPRSTGHLRINDLLGKSVIDPAGDDIGRISDFVFNPESGQISYAVISVGGFLGMGEKHFTVPFDKLNLQADKGRYVLESSSERVLSAPAARDTATPGWNKEIDDYWTRDADTPNLR